MATAMARLPKAWETEVDKEPRKHWLGQRRPPVRCDEASLKEVSKSLLVPMVQYAELHGLLYAAKDQSIDPSAATQCPVAMLPFKIPAQAFDECVALSKLWNELVDAVARDLPWLYATLEPAANADPFTARLMGISKAVHAAGLRQKLMLGIHRSDYMLHEPGDSSPRFLQVELNTIASSMASHSANTETLHRYLLSRYGEGSDPTALALREHFGGAGELVSHLPQNATLKEIPAALARAHGAYGAKDAVVLMVVQEEERNFADQRWLEYALWEEHGVKVVRKSLGQLHRELAMDPSSGRLRLDSGAGQEVSVVYFRAGYSPDDYSSEAEWEARLVLEQSLAIKCPSVDYQLVGAKKVQQALARQGAVERFIGPGDSSKLRGCFAGLWGLGLGEDDSYIIKKACSDPNLYVLKPQREGGGNNFYGKDVATQLKKLSEQERGAYILMQRILPKLQSTVMTRAGTAEVMLGLSEFGFFSVFLGDGRQALLSEHAGHLVRTKADGVDEGGVAAGYAVISSPFLVQ
ncbi:unnamed protein product [Polarella glacialis]|uniref:Glutathione synthetase n=1 Tax=Polarella glacialis TaxID=89957 RepID=A0A813JS24_POLGL|nr:unnamed protein product [Polarella glacialis]CAE8685561.1 unnamed protein product [Polarella glacialis]